MRRTFREPHLEKWWVGGAAQNESNSHEAARRTPLLSPSRPRPGQVSRWPADQQAEELPPGARALPTGADVAGAIGRARVWPGAPGAEARRGLRSVLVRCRQPQSSRRRVPGAEPRRGAEGGWVGRGGGGRERARSSRARAGAGAALSQAAVGAASLLPF